jgi:hypothetical protein
VKLLYRTFDGAWWCRRHLPEGIPDHLRGTALEVPEFVECCICLEELRLQMIGV